MADLTVTAANVAKGTRAQVTSGTAGAAIAQGKSVYLDSATATIKLADADAEASADCVGVALNAAEIGQPVTYQTSGNFNPGATVVVGKAYYVSTTAGGICPEADLGTGDYVTLIGFGTTTSNILMTRTTTGIAKA